MRKAERFFILFLLALTPALTQPAFAQKAQKGVVIVEEATVFQEPDFDSAVLGTLSAGGVYDMSVAKKGMFYKVRLKPGTTGWVSDAEIKPTGSAASQKRPTNAGKAADRKKKGIFSDPLVLPPEHDKLSKSRPMTRKRYHGPVLEFMNYVEDTMGAIYRQSNMMFYGYKWSGNNTLMDGEMYIDSEILFRFSPPQYYADATRNSASGFMLVGNFLFENEQAQGRDDMLFYGFGPTFKYTHYEVTLNNDPSAGKKRSYSLDDMTVGMVFNFGMAHDFGGQALRFDLRYYWETRQYLAFGLAFQFEF